MQFDSRFNRLWRSTRGKSIGNTRGTRSYSTNIIHLSLQSVAKRHRLLVSPVQRLDLLFLLYITAPRSILLYDAHENHISKRLHSDGRHYLRTKSDTDPHSLGIPRTRALLREPILRPLPPSSTLRRGESPVRPPWEKRPITHPRTRNSSALREFPFRASARIRLMREACREVGDTLGGGRKRSRAIGTKECQEGREARSRSDEKKRN